MDAARDRERTFSAHEAARMAGISKNTLLRWLKRGKVAEVPRDRNGWRIFSARDVASITAYAEKTTPPSRARPGARQSAAAGPGCPASAGRGVGIEGQTGERAEEAA